MSTTETTTPTTDLEDRDVRALRARFEGVVGCGRFVGRAELVKFGGFGFAHASSPEAVGRRCSAGRRFAASRFTPTGTCPGYL